MIQIRLGLLEYVRFVWKKIVKISESVVTVTKSDGELEKFERLTDLC